MGKNTGREIGGETEHFIACRRRIWRLDDTSDTSCSQKQELFFPSIAKS